MRKITIVDDDSKYDISIRELSEDPKSEYPDELDVIVTIDGQKYFGNLTKKD